MRVSVIIPCYNVEAYVATAVHSALEQDHEDLELICVNDGSTDATQRVLEELATSTGGRVVVIEQVNKGACAARNRGLEMSTGTYIEFLDADDHILPGKITHQLTLAAGNDHPELIIGSSRTRRPDGTIVTTDIQKCETRDPWMDLMSHKLGGSPQNLWRRDAVVKAGGWAEGLGSSQEYDLMFRMLQQDARLIHDPEVLTEILQRAAGSISQVNLDRNWRRFVDLRVRIVEHLRSRYPERDMKPDLQVLFDSIRTLYPFDPKGAVALYEAHIPTDFEPGLSSATGKGYLMLHRSFGFKLANRLRQLVA
jgi:glycosyltransferase involved in cell wall biosynthesis